MGHLVGVVELDERLPRPVEPEEAQQPQPDLVASLLRPRLVAVQRQQLAAVDGERLPGDGGVTVGDGAAGQLLELHDVDRHLGLRAQEHLLAAEHHGAWQVDGASGEVGGLVQLGEGLGRRLLRPDEVDHLLTVQPQAGRDREDLHQRRGVLARPPGGGDHRAVDRDLEAAEQPDVDGRRHRSTVGMVGPDRRTFGAKCRSAWVRRSPRRVDRRFAGSVDSARRMRRLRGGAARSGMLGMLCALTGALGGAFRGEPERGSARSNPARVALGPQPRGEGRVVRRSRRAPLSLRRVRCRSAGSAVASQGPLSLRRVRCRFAGSAVTSQGPLSLRRVRGLCEVYAGSARWGGGWGAPRRWVGRVGSTSPRTSGRTRTPSGACADTTPPVRWARGPKGSPDTTLSEPG